MKATTQPILSLVGSDAVTVETSQEARLTRDSLLHLAAQQTGISTPADADLVADALRTVKAFTREIEESRKDVKAPVLEIGKRIDALAAELTAELEQQAKRLSSMLGAYQAEQRKKEEEARRAAWQEEQRIKEETARKLAEAEAKSRNASSFEKKAEKIEAQAIAQIVNVRSEVAAATVAKPAGIATRENLVFEVEDVGALYAHAPHLCIVQPNNAALRAYLKANPKVQLPGVRHWTETNSYVR